MKRVVPAVAAALIASMLMDSAAGQRRPRDPDLPPPAPAPRNEEGRVLLGGATPADKGVWTPLFGIFDPIAPAEEVPFKPWAKALYSGP